MQSMRAIGGLTLLMALAPALGQQPAPPAAPGNIVEADVCIYGGTSGGVAAAVQVARMGKRAVIAEPGKHLGGMTSGGLSAVDIGNPRSVGGIAREYFTRLAGTSGKTLAWEKPPEGPVPTGGAFAVEPHTAEQLFNEMVKEAAGDRGAIAVHFEKRLASARKEGGRIVELAMDDGSLFRATMFIDATYEGDVMARAGVSYTLNREANAQYGETLNGIQFNARYTPRREWGKPGRNGRRSDGKGIWDRDLPMDPYVVKGEPARGVLPLVEAAGEIGPVGSAAPGVQAYCYRLCMTDRDDNRIPIAQPPGYDPRRYELVARFIAACIEAGDDMDLRWFTKYDPIPNGKYDFNTATFGGNLPGASWEWAEASWKRRAEIAAEHERYHRGLLWFLASDERVPAKVREEIARFGLCKDEFPDTRGWPHQLYIREARRMVSDLVMTENHCRGKDVAAGSVALGSYGMDIHEIRRVVKDGIVWREGKLGGGVPQPYPIGYGAIVPKPGECENLFVTFALSASHVAFGSIRMEPVFMALSQSAGTAACMAIDGKIAVQQVDYASLRKRLLADKQILEWTAPPARSSTRPAASGAADIDLGKLAGIVVDDADAKLTGEWSKTTKQNPFVGEGYLHDGRAGHGEKSAKFTANLPQAGEYEVRLIYSATPNRATRVPVTVTCADGDKEIHVNQREDPFATGVPRAIGVFRFEAGAGAAVVISNANADGFVIVDAVQWVPLEAAKAERAQAATRPATTRPDTAASPATRAVSNQPVQLARASQANEIDGKSFDVVVIGGTPGGVACAVRAAREGLSVLLVNHTAHLGGMMANGLVQWDALYGGPRAPLFSELLRNIEAHYRSTYGEKSADFRAARFTQAHYPIGTVEPHVAEREFNRLIAGEQPRLAVLLEHYPTQVVREGAIIRSVTLAPMKAREGQAAVRAIGGVFVDATYEGDLAAVAKAPYRVGREAREEYKEPHAGKLFANIDHHPGPQDAVDGKLNIRPYGSRQGSIDPTSPFTADGAVQAYNFRFCVTNDPANRILLAEPPPNYRREEYVNYDRKSIATNPGPGRKSHMNSPILPGENHAYPDGDWPTREKIARRHLEFALGLMWFLQNDPSVSAGQREKFRQWGLPRDEFADNGHVPYEMYVREARRIVGRHVYTEHDNSLAPGLGRTPIHPDSIAITDWYMDSHSCTTDSRPGFRYDGKLILTEESRPGQIPYRSLLPQGIDNLLVPVCLSATHVAWGAVRLEPVWMGTGEAAGIAAAIAVATKVAPAQVDVDRLSRTLCEKRFLVSFFNDVDVSKEQPWVPAIQYFGARGFFATYDARPEAPLDGSTAAIWQRGLAQRRAGQADPMALARELMKVEPDSKSITVAAFARSIGPKALEQVKELGLQPDDPITRGQACGLMYRDR